MINFDEITNSNNVDDPTSFISDKEILEQMDVENIIKEAVSAKERIYDSIAAKLGFEEEGKRKGFFTHHHFFVVAASVLVLSGLGFLLCRSGFGIGNKVLDALEAYSPNGAMLSVTLPDSTEVILNSGSVVRYPSSFTKNQRVIQLNGEAFFDVSKDPANPFIIQTQGMEVKVLGTRFNLKSFEDEDVVQLTLEEGAIVAQMDVSDEKKEVCLAPGEQIILNKRTGEITNKKVELQRYIGWTSGRLFFNDNTLEEIARELEKKFDVVITIASERFKKQRFYCDFGQDDSLDYILGLLSLGSSWTYKISGNQIRINP